MVYNYDRIKLPIKAVNEPMISNGGHFMAKASEKTTVRQAEGDERKTALASVLSKIEKDFGTGRQRAKKANIHKKSRQNAKLRLAA